MTPGWLAECMGEGWIEREMVERIDGGWVDGRNRGRREGRTKWRRYSSTGFDLVNISEGEYICPSECICMYLKETATPLIVKYLLNSLLCTVLGNTSVWKKRSPPSKNTHCGRDMDKFTSN